MTQDVLIGRPKDESSPSSSLQTQIGKRVRWRRDLFESTDPVDWAFKDPKSVEVDCIAENTGIFKGERTVYFKEPFLNRHPFSPCYSAFESLLEYV